MIGNEDDARDCFVGAFINKFVSKIKYKTGCNGLKETNCLPDICSKGAEMARKTNYKFEKLDRERRKAEKKAAKAEAKQAQNIALNKQKIDEEDQKQDNF